MLSVVNGLSVLYMKVKGFFYILIGLTWLFYQSPTREAGIAWSDFLTPITVGILWITAGAIAIVTAFLKSHAGRKVGFFVLILVPVLLGSYFLISWLAYITPIFETSGYQRGVITTASYWAYGASAYIMGRVYAFSSGGIEDNARGVRP